MISWELTTALDERLNDGTAPEITAGDRGTHKTGTKSLQLSKQITEIEGIIFRTAGGS